MYGKSLLRFLHVLRFWLQLQVYKTYATQQAISLSKVKIFS